MHMAVVDTEWLALAEDISRLQGKAFGHFERVFSSGFRFFLRRALGREKLEANLIDCLRGAFEACSDFIVREPHRAPEVCLSYVKAFVSERSQSLVAKSNYRPRPDTYKAYLRELDRSELEVLRRYYAEGESKEEVCLQLNISLVRFEQIRLAAYARVVTPVTSSPARTSVTLQSAVRRMA